MNREKIARELIKVARSLVAGTWALPRNDAEAKQLLSVIRQMEKGESPDSQSPAGALHSILGDDQLFDTLDKLENLFLKDSAVAIKRRIQQFAKDDASTFSDANEKAMIDWVAKQLR